MTRGGGCPVIRRIVAIDGNNRAGDAASMPQNTTLENLTPQTLTPQNLTRVRRDTS